MLFTTFIKSEKVLLTVAIFLVLGCSSTPEVKDGESFSSYLLKSDGSPKTVAILPFQNETTDKGLGPLVRRSFYNHFSSKNYSDIEINEIDGVLKIISDTSSNSWERMSPTQLGEILQADFLIYGRVKGFDKIFLGIYSQIALNLEIKMLECKRGQVIWSRATDYKSHEGEVPTTLVGIVTAALRSGYHLRDDEVMELIERTNRELINEIPDPPNPTVSISLIEIQIASFKEKARAMETRDSLKKKGFRARIIPVVIDGQQWHRVIVGPYYKKLEAEKVKREITRDYGLQPTFIYHSMGER